MNSDKELIIKFDMIRDKFLALDMYTPSVGLAFGIIGYSSTLSQ